MAEEKNQIIYISRCLGITAFILIIASLFPEIQLGNFKKADFLSDLFKLDEHHDPSSLFADAIPYELSDIVNKDGFPDSAFVSPFRMFSFSDIPLEDFTDGNNGLENISTAINSNEIFNRPVRIAFLGDSFTEGEILTSHLRDSLQNNFGGKGIGFVPIVTPVKHRINSIVDYKNLISKTIVRTSGAKMDKFTLTGQYFVPQEKAWFSVKSTGKFNNISGWRYADILYSCPDTVHLTLRSGSGKLVPHLLPAGNRILLESIAYDDPTYIEANISNNAEMILYGIFLNDHKGIYVDNFSLRSSSGPNLSLINYDLLAELNELMKYDLVILQYGLNVAEAYRSSYTAYKEKMVEVINKLKESMPETDFMIMSISNRNLKDSNGNFSTMPGIKNMVKEQREIARETKITFWNTFEAMGGEGSMAEFVKKRLASTDYTHINYSGGKILGEKLATTLIEAITQYGNNDAGE